ncbi:MAG: LPP20 family lipoprotein [Alphaproteobacteria bacterium]|nr:LPP20 family lipoprotein [Alphaproteobacteria bacterium]
MKKSVNLLLTTGLLGALTACSSVNVSSVPNWVNKPQSNCQNSEFCASGSGSSERVADADARSSIAKIFETKVNSTFSSTLSQEDDIVKSSMKDALKESVQATLNTVEIVERFKADGQYYSFAVLDKDKSAKIVREQIDDTDEKMEQLLTDNSASSASKVKRLYEQRFSLNQQYIVLTGSSISSKISYEQVFKNAKAKIGKTNIFVKLIGSTNKKAEASVKNVMREQGYTFVKSQAEGRVLTVEVNKTQLPFSIKGMVKYQYVISLHILNSNGSTNDVLDETYDGAGINEAQAFDEALRDFEVDFKNKIEELDF